MRKYVFAILLLAVAAGCRSWPRGQGPVGGIGPVDSGGRPIQELQLGSSLEMRGSGLQPLTPYEFRAALDDGTVVGYARLSSDRRGEIPPFVLWYQSGVIGCATRPADERRPVRFRTFEEAEAALRGRSLRITAAPRNQEQARAAAFTVDLPIAPRRAPMIYPSNRDGCLVNALEAQTADLYVAGRNFEAGETVVISVAPNQRAWYGGDAVADVSGANGASSPNRVTADANGRFVVKAWDSAIQQRGAYDLVAQPVGGRNIDLSHIDPRDTISFGNDTALILFLLYPPGGSNQDLAGRPITGWPYFEFADSFADKADTVYGAVDPTYIPAGHPGGVYGAYYVVDHRTAPQWAITTNLSDVSSDSYNVMPIKAGCINATTYPIWPADAAQGEYDVVVDFGIDPVTFAVDNNYDVAVDFLDGGIQIGFVVAPDPYELGTFDIGEASYSFDDHFPTMDGVPNVDLRAVIRYPATAPGLNMPVAAGTYPLFIMQHGNHAACRVCTDGIGYYEHLKQYYLSGMDPVHLSTCTYTHATCPDREKNHEGYMRLLDILASNGIIAVSLDAYDFMRGTVAMNGRADLILRHLEMMSHLDNAASFPAYPNPAFGGLFNGHIDLSKISIAGHSRGGEAVVVAYHRNALLPVPFSINSVASIEPTDFQASPGLPNVPYFLILGAADGDVSNMWGAKIYDRAAEATTKSHNYVYGANHNFFNTVWAAEFDDYADRNPGFPPRADFIPAANQQKLGEAYTAAFVLRHLNGVTVYDDLLRGGLTFPSTAGSKIYHTRHESSHAKLDAGGAPIGAASGMATSASQLNPSVHQTTATRLGWTSATGVYTYTVPPAQKDASGFEVLSFRVAQTNSASNPVSGNQNYAVELLGGGNMRAVFVGQFEAIPRPYSRPDLSHNVMTTVRIPLHSFIINNSGVKLDDVQTIRFQFTGPATGEIYVDDVEFSR